MPARRRSTAPAKSASDRADPLLRLCKKFRLRRYAIYASKSNLEEL